MTTLLFHINYIDKDDLTTKVLRLSTQRYRTTPSDTPANTPYLDQVLQAGSISQHLHAPGRTFGPSEVGTGDLVVSNADRSLDYLRGQGFSLQSFEILSVQSEKQALSTATTIFTGIVEQALFDWTTVRFVPRDALAEIDVEILSEVFAGDNTDGSGYEGVEETIGGKFKPFVEGTVRHISPPLCNILSQLFCVSFDSSGAPEAATINAVYANFKAVALDTAAVGSTSGDYASISALTTAQLAGDIAAGKHATCNAEGAFAISTALLPSDVITADVTRADTTAADIVSNIWTDRVGLSGARLNSASFSALNSAQSADLGIYVDSQKSALAAVSDILTGIDGHFYTDSLANAVVGRLAVPAGSPVRTLEQYEIIEDRGNGLRKIEVSDPSVDGTEGLPFRRVRLGGQKIWRKFTESDFAGTIDLDQREYGLNEYRYKEADATNDVATVHEGSGTLEIRSLLDSLPAIQTEANRQRTLRQEVRDIWEVPVEFDGEIVPLNSELKLNITRFGFDSGMSGTVLGYEFDLSNLIVKYFIWV
jgi:hypothetical protein